MTENFETVLSIKDWLLKLNGTAKSADRISVIDSAASKFPFSYKLIYRQLCEHLKAAENCFPTHSNWIKLIEISREASQRLSKYPRIWIFRFECLERVGRLCELQIAFVEALRFLPLSQHALLWNSFLSRAALFPTAIACRLFDRYRSFNADGHDRFLRFAEERALHREAHSLLWEMLQKELPSNYSAYELALKLCNNATLADLREEELQRSFEYVMRRFSDHLGNAWVLYADCYVRKGLFERARDVFERAMNELASLRDFAVVYNAYLRFEEAMLAVDEPQNALTTTEAEVDALLGLSPPRRLDCDGLRTLSIERVMQKREEWLAGCRLRINPASVDNWLRRLDVCPSAVFATKAVEALNALRGAEVEGRISDVIVRLAEHYWQNNGRKANALLEFALRRRLPQSESVFLARYWIETLLRRGFAFDALSLIRRLLIERNERLPCKAALRNSAELWSLYTDLTLFLGTTEESLQVYRQMLAADAFNAESAISFALILRAIGRDEEAFRVAEEILPRLTEPVAGLFRLAHLKSIEERFVLKNIEVVRDSYDSALAECDPTSRHLIAIAYAEFEERRGFRAFAEAIFSQTIDQSDASHRAALFKAQIAFFARVGDVPAARRAFAAACDALPLADVPQTAIDFARFEQNCGEVVRARAVHVFLAQYSEPAVDPFDAWRLWEEFELECGNEDSYRELLRVKRLTERKYAVLPPTAARVARQIAAESAVEAPNESGNGDERSIAARN